MAFQLTDPVTLIFSSFFYRVGHVFPRFCSSQPKRMLVSWFIMQLCFRVSSSFSLKLQLHLLMTF